MKSTLDKTPPELAADIMDRGIVLAGGGALLQGLDDRVRHETQIPVHLAESPLTCVAVGSGRSLEEFEVIHRTNRSRAARRNGLLRVLDASRRVAARTRPRSGRLQGSARPGFRASGILVCAGRSCSQRR